MKHVKTLIDLASKKCGSDAALCRHLGIAGNHPAEWRSGKRAVSPETIAALCNVLDVSPDEAQDWLAVSVIENPKNASRAEVLRKVFFASWAAVAAVGLFGHQQTAEAAMTDDAMRIGATTRGNSYLPRQRALTYESGCNSLYIMSTTVGLFKPTRPPPDQDAELATAIQP